MTVITVVDTACVEYDFNGRLLQASGTYVDIIPNAAGCDSVTVLFLTILNPMACDLYVTTGGEYSFGGDVLTETGIYRDTLVNAQGVIRW